MKKNIEALRHSASHIMAQAVMRLYPGTKLGIGPAIEDGFYYDFEFPGSFSEDDLEKITAEMKNIIKEGQPFERQVVSKEEAGRIFSDQPYKKELLDEIPEDEDVSLYRNSEFVDLCRGPHVDSTSRVKHFRLLKTAGAYWKGEEKNPMLTRIYGTVFPTGGELDGYLKMQELARERDHRKLGRELDLFSLHPEEAGPGLVFWHPRGAAVRRAIEDFWLNEHQRSGYELVNIPHVARSRLWETSGHLEFYKDHMYPLMEFEQGGSYVIKPMNCPGHILVYKNSIRSYREFPIRWAELGTVYRYEKPGVLHGLMRVRGFTQDDAHIFCRPDQVREEISRVLRFIIRMLSGFGFREYGVFLSTRPEKFVGTPKEWDEAEEALKEGLKEVSLDYEVDPGEGVFYGPKIDIKIKDSLGRMWQCSTVQVDFNIPGKFELEYVNDRGEKETPVMIHRALLGSLERFFGVLIEHYGGRFPLWLAPVQAELVPVSEKNLEYCLGIKETLESSGIRVGVSAGSDKLGKKIWRLRKLNVPYMAVAGDREAEEGVLSVRKLGGDQMKFSPEEFLKLLQDEISRGKGEP